MTAAAAIHLIPVIQLEAATAIENVGANVKNSATAAVAAVSKAFTKIEMLLCPTAMKR